MAEADLTVYVVRPSDRVADRIEAEHKRLEKQRGSAAADAWEDALEEAIASLATLGKRCHDAPEDTLFQRVSPGAVLRQHIFQPTRNSAAWRILFTVHETDANDPPTVRIQMLRHGAQAPLTYWPEDDE